MSKQIFVINGSGGCGKDTFVSFISKIIPTSNFSSVEKIKIIASLCGWDGKKTEKDRKFLSDLKHLTTIYNDMSFNDISDYVNDFKKGLFDTKVCFIHIREPEEIKRACKSFSAKSILIKNNRVDMILTNDADANVYNYNYKYDYVIENNGSLEELEQAALKFYESIIICGSDCAMNVNKDLGVDNKGYTSGDISVINIPNTNQYEINIETCIGFESKEKLYEFYKSLYESFDNHFKQVTLLAEIDNHQVMFDGEKVHISKTGSYYTLDNNLNFKGTMADCRDWFYGTMQNIYNECFN